MSVLMLDEGPEGEDFVLTRKLNLHENHRHGEDILDQVSIVGYLCPHIIFVLQLVGWIRDGRERDYQLFKRNPTPG